MSWFLFALAGYFLYAVVTVINKFLLRQRATTKPIVFTFYIGVLSIFTFIIAPFGDFSWPGFQLFLFDLFVGVIFFVAIWAFYEALDVNEASRVAPLIGGLIPIIVLLLSYIFLTEYLTRLQILAFFLLVFGGVLVSLKKSRGGIKESLRGFNFIILAIIFHAIYWILAKYVFENQEFITGFIWSRMGLVLASGLVLLRPTWRKMIFDSEGQMTAGLGGGLIGAKIIAGFGSLLVHLAISMGSVALISAMQGIEYVFLLILTVIFSLKFPKFLEEKISGQILAQKIIAVLLIGAGLVILAV
ncbi:MAG: hypothetical protein A2174_00525 [Candidatus Portnoybacteria bacterium RBG_13_41_18]|uniref:EamA domain-containing protein n=1 Tax=Candidatus Portnoybacteria bacterium RBG_13_41_18 TaxID=1801991 RepID=A0A1G2FBV2_9BACT|nr:MAG: hypothetical protein A2174_00525 [Candidatus Portnoybacteria bacterium RBG_13_41_18]